MRDRDSLPVVNELFDGVERIADFKAVLTRTAASSDVKPETLPMEYVGNKQLTDAGLWTAEPYKGQLRSPRSRHGRVQVTVQLKLRGRHYVDLYGLEDASPTAAPDRARLVRFPWRVAVEGVCSASEDVCQECDEPFCYCRPGFYRPGGVSNARCKVCPKGKIKSQIADKECTSCGEAHEIEHQETDPMRRETIGEGGEDSSLHDSLSDCGCSVNYIMKFRSLTPDKLQEKCPRSSSVDRWTNEPDAAARLRGYQTRCCVNGRVATVPLQAHNVSNNAQLTNDLRATLPDISCDMSTSWAWKCVERACREDYLANMTVSVHGNASEYGKCVQCNKNKTICSETHLTTVHMGIRNGYWRSNELSTDVRQCFPSAACVGTNSSRPTLAEEICRHGHHGPFCASCMDNYFKNITKLCAECSSAYTQLIVALLPLIIVFGVSLSVGVCASLRRCGPRIREQLHASYRWSHRAVQFLFGPISFRAFGLVITAKGKIVWSMLQVQLGVISAFAIEFPVDLMGALG